MGLHDVDNNVSPEELRAFTRQLIKDVRAMEHMLREGMFDTGPRRIGAEQELFLVDSRWQPAPLAMEVLEHSTDDRLVTELTRFNLEFNLHPSHFGGTCLSDMEVQINELMSYTRKLAATVGAQVAITGILPTIHLSDLGLDNMAPIPRYFALNDALLRLRGGPAQFQIRGVDELFFKHDTILVEGCNTSFQTHFQVTPEEFPRFYNFAQAIAGPVLACSANSPVLFGKRLWRETRIALFQQAVDTRSSNLYLREMSPRVHFGSGWVEKSVMDLYKEDIARFRVILTTKYEDPFEVLADGKIPKLHALMLHNGTVYRWNRACYGITEGVPHLRIENRILPAGPSVVDEVANAAFWFGLVAGLAEEVEDIRDHLEFDHAKNNFVSAARQGIDSHLTWFNGERYAAVDLITDKLLPIARKGLASANIASADIDKYLGTIEKRCATKMSGSQWLVESLATMRRTNPDSTRADRLNSTVSSMIELQKTGAPGHEWPLATLDDSVAMRWMPNTRVEHFMSTDLFTVNEDEIVELVACIMDWRRIRHILVEDVNQRLVGIISHRSLLRFLSEHGGSKGQEVAVSEIMVRDPISISADRPTIEAIDLMRKHQIGALPVLQAGELVGIITERDFYKIAGELLDDTVER
ncbi:MAG: CBS domain-containing protein [Rhodothermales bacterium]|nr:CBS domain-containing protein [Rhodothermales bacterium]